MSVIKKVFGYLRAHWAISLMVVLLALLVVWKLNGGGAAAVSVDYTVKETPITEEVAVTGRIKPVRDVSMAFEKTGRITSVYRAVGDTVYPGEVLVSLDGTSPLAQLQQEQTKLDQLIRGSRPETIAVKQSAVATAEQDLAGLYGNVFDTLNDAYVRSEDAVRVKTSSIFTGSPINGYKLTFSSCDTQMENAANTERVAVEAQLNLWRAELITVSTASDQDLYTALKNAQKRLILFRSLLDNTQGLLNQNCVLSNSGLDTYRASISGARSNLATAISNVWEKVSAIDNSKAALSSAKTDVALLSAGSDPKDIEAQKAKVADAESEVGRFQLRAPFGGVVTKQGAKVGEIAYANTELVSLISNNAYEIEVNVPELDITRIKKGNTAKVTLDAYGPDTSFPSVVSKVDPAETIVDNVPTYKVTLALSSADARIKSGLTANVYITTAQKDAVLTIPSRALMSKDGVKTVIIRNGKEMREQVVTLGMRGNSGEVEILTGISVGDIIMIPNASAKK